MDLIVGGQHLPVTVLDLVLMGYSSPPYMEVRYDEPYQMRLEFSEAPAYLRIMVELGAWLTDPEQDDYEPPYGMCWSCEGIGRMRGYVCQACYGHGLRLNP